MPSAVSLGQLVELRGLQDVQVCAVASGARSEAARASWIRNDMTQRSVERSHAVVKKPKRRHRTTKNTEEGRCGKERSMECRRKASSEMKRIGGMDLMHCRQERPPPWANQRRCQRRRRTGADTARGASSNKQPHAASLESSLETPPDHIYMSVSFRGRLIVGKVRNMVPGRYLAAAKTVLS